MSVSVPTLLRRLDTGGLALDVALAGMAGLALALSGLFRPEALPPLWLCPFRELTGLPCPGCGLTRAFCAITHGHFASAWALNPFGFVFYAGALGLLAWPLLRRRCPAWVKAAATSPWAGRAALALVVAMWAFGGWRLWTVLHGQGQ